MIRLPGRRPWRLEPSSHLWLAAACRWSRPLAGTVMAAIGRIAAEMALAAFAIPAPQVCVVQMHSEVCISDELAGTWQVGGAGVVVEVVGKVFADSFRRAINCAPLRLPLTDLMRPAMPATIGAEKLVPRLSLIWSV